MDVLLVQEGALRKEDRAILSIACGFFARIGLALPKSYLFERISELVSSSTCSSHETM